MLYATMSSKHASNHISFVLMKCLLLVTFVSHQPVSCLFLILFFYVYVFTYIFHPDIYHRKTPSHEDSEYFGLFFKVCFFCDTKISVFCCQWTHGLISFYLHCENYWVLLQPKTGIQVPKGSCLMYIKKKKKTSLLTQQT